MEGVGYGERDTGHGVGDEVRQVMEVEEVVVVVLYAARET